MRRGDHRGQTGRGTGNAVDQLLGDDQQAWAGFAEAAWYGPLRHALRQARRNAGLTQQELARRLGRDQADISRLEIGLTERVPLGIIKNYLDQCGAQLEIMVRDREGRVLLHQRSGLKTAGEEPVEAPTQSSGLSAEQMDALAEQVAGKVALRLRSRLEEDRGSSYAVLARPGEGEQSDAQAHVAKIEPVELASILAHWRPSRDVVESLHEARAPWWSSVDAAMLGQVIEDATAPLRIRFPSGREILVLPSAERREP